jgi:hypothetical protein
MLGQDEKMLVAMLRFLFPGEPLPTAFEKAEGILDFRKKTKRHVLSLIKKSKLDWYGYAVPYVFGGEFEEKRFSKNFED